MTSITAPAKQGLYFLLLSVIFIKNLFPVFKYIGDYYRKEFNVFYFALVLLLLGVLIWLNYRHGLEARYVAGETGSRSFIGYYLLYFIPFALAFFLQLL